MAHGYWRREGRFECCPVNVGGPGGLGEPVARRLQPCFLG